VPFGEAITILELHLYAVSFYEGQSYGLERETIKMAYSALEIAKYVINHEHKENREITNLRLQKLLYFVQAKILVETGNPCFDDEMVAWDYGPVVLAVYEEYCKYHSRPIDDTASISLTDTEIVKNIDEVLDYLGDTATFELVQITHAQTPWINARQRGKGAVISKESIREFFEAA